MLAIFAITGPIFALMGLGFFCVRLGFFQQADTRILGHFVINLALPALLIATLSQRNPADIFRANYLFASACGTLVAFLVVLFVSLRLRRCGLRESAVRAMGVSVSNKAFMGLPIVAQVLGPLAPVALALTLVAEDIVILPLALLLADLGERQGRGLRALMAEIFRSLTHNPVILAICVGLSLACLNLSLPGPVLKALEMLGQAAAPTALFAIGGTLGGSMASLRGSGLSWADLGWIATVKLVLHPLLVGLLAAQTTLDPQMQAAAILYASMPIFSIYPLFGMKYGMAVFCSALVVLATFCSFASISASIWFVQTCVLP